MINKKSNSKYTVTSEAKNKLRYSVVDKHPKLKSETQDGFILDKLLNYYDENEDMHKSISFFDILNKIISNEDIPYIKFKNEINFTKIRINFLDTELELNSELVIFNENNKIEKILKSVCNLYTELLNRGIYIRNVNNNDLNSFYNYAVEYIAEYRENNNQTQEINYKDEFIDENHEQYNLSNRIYTEHKTDEYIINSDEVSVEKRVSEYFQLIVNKSTKRRKSITSLNKSRNSNNSKCTAISNIDTEKLYLAQKYNSSIQLSKNFKNLTFNPKINDYIFVDPYIHNFLNENTPFFINNFSLPNLTYSGYNFETFSKYISYYQELSRLTVIYKNIDLPSFSDFINEMSLQNFQNPLKTRLLITQLFYATAENSLLNLEEDLNIQTSSIEAICVPLNKYFNHTYLDQLDAEYINYCFYCLQFYSKYSKYVIDYECDDNVLYALISYISHMNTENHSLKIIQSKGFRKYIPAAKKKDNKLNYYTIDPRFKNDDFYNEEMKLMKLLVFMNPFIGTDRFNNKYYFLYEKEDFKIYVMFEDNNVYEFGKNYIEYIIEKLRNNGNSESQLKQKLFLIKNIYEDKKLLVINLIENVRKFLNNEYFKEEDDSNLTVKELKKIKTENHNNLYNAIKKKFNTKTLTEDYILNKLEQLEDDLFYTNVYYAYRINLMYDSEKERNSIIRLKNSDSFMTKLADVYGTWVMFIKTHDIRFKFEKFTCISKSLVETLERLIYDTDIDYTIYPNYKSYMKLALINYMYFIDDKIVSKFKLNPKGNTYFKVGNQDLNNVFKKIIQDKNRPQYLLRKR